MADRKTTKKSGKGTISKFEADDPAAGGDGAEGSPYRYEIIEDVPADQVQAKVEPRRAREDYVTHNIEAEDDGEFTLFFVFRN